MDRYQEEIRRVAAKSVKDLNLENLTNNQVNHHGQYRAIPRRLSNGSDASHSSSSSSSRSGGGTLATPSNANQVVSINNQSIVTTSINVAAAKMQYLQKINQINLSNQLKSAQNVNGIRRQSAGSNIAGAQQAFRPNEAALTKASSASNISNQRTSMVGSNAMSQHGSHIPNHMVSIAQCRNGTTPSLSSGNVSSLNRQAIIAASRNGTPIVGSSSVPCSQNIVLSSKQGLSQAELLAQHQQPVPSLILKQNAVTAQTLRSTKVEPLFHPHMVSSALPLNVQTPVSSVSNDEKVQYQPGSYPQLKRASLTNIPIYENIDGYPVIPQRGQQVTPPPPPPPYSGHHTIVSSSLTKTVPRCGINEEKKNHI